MIATNPETRYVPMTVEDSTRERIKMIADRDGMKMARLVDAMSYGWEMLTAEQRVAAMRGGTVPHAPGSTEAQSESHEQSSVHDHSIATPPTGGPDTTGAPTPDAQRR